MDLREGLSPHELHVVEQVADAITDAETDAIKASGIPYPLGLPLMHRAEVLNLASGLFATAKLTGGDAELMARDFAAMVQHAVRDMVLKADPAQGRA